MVKRRIFVLTLAASGHLNPMCGLVHELCKKPDIECFVYNSGKFREAIEKTGASFCLYPNVDALVAKYSEAPRLTDKGGHAKFFANFMDFQFQVSYECVPQLVNDVVTQKPDLIIYDPSFYPAKFLIEILKKKAIPMKYVEFFPNFVFDQEMMKTMPGADEKSFGQIWTLIKSFYKQYQISKHFNLSTYNPFTLMAPVKEHMKIVAVFPELHPRVNNYDSQHNFVGQCVSEVVRNQDFDSDLQLKSILDLFPIRDQSNQSTNGLKLIYMSLGTIFHSNIVIFDHFIEALRNYDKKTVLKFKSSQFRAILSVGDKSMDAFEKRISSGQLSLPQNILIREKVPQLEVLKRAHLFITHSGMNSISETIKYAVPIISIPLEGDQQINGIRSCDELQLGIRLEALKINSDVFCDTIEKVLADEKYAKNIKEMSDTSAKYNGRVEGTKLIMNYLNQE
uniref:UDP-glucuronosyltransferase-like protein 3 n=1 Tax=Brachionus rotundiformis TaxID=96890 RepID=A0A7H9SLG4_9BILA|nr:UDP-glucuronosyltransferase-like protein 3 [Brachionus rotundiformis]